MQGKGQGGVGRGNVLLCEELQNCTASSPPAFQGFAFRSFPTQLALWLDGKDTKIQSEQRTFKKNGGEYTKEQWLDDAKLTRHSTSTKATPEK